MSFSDLKNWRILTLLEPSFVATIHKVLVYGDLANEALIVTKNDMVYGLGCNRAGCLGIDDTSSTLRPKKIENLCNKGIQTFAYGSGPHVLALTREGQVYSWGYNSFGEVGNGREDNTLIPTLITLKFRIIDIACGSHHSLALTDTGKVYGWGHNDNGQVGHILSGCTASIIDLPLTHNKVVSISCGHNHSMAITNYGEVYGWGDNGVGQLGRNSYSNYAAPELVKQLVGVVITKVVCGYAHTLALSDEGGLYAWGSNGYGQLGLGDKLETSVCKKLFIPKMGRVLDIAALHSSHISVAIGKRHKVFIWGACLGQTLTVPTPVSLTTLHDALAYFSSPAIMHCPLVISTEEEMDILKCWREAFDDETTSDLAIEVEEKFIYVHKACLKIRCQYFRKMFQECWTENNESVIRHDQFSYEVYKSFLRYLYTDEVEVSSFKDALELLELANAYLETRLKHQCIQIIKQSIKISNVCLLYRTAIERNAKELEDFSFKFALNHMTAVIQSDCFKELDEAMTKSFIIKAAQLGAFVS